MAYRRRFRVTADPPAGPYDVAELVHGPAFNDAFEKGKDHRVAGPRAVELIPVASEPGVWDVMMEYESCADPGENAHV